MWSKKWSIHTKDGLAVKSISVRIYDTYNCFVFLSTCVEMAWWMEAWKDGWMVPRWIMVFVFRLCLLRIKLKKKLEKT